MSDSWMRKIVKRMRATMLFALGWHACSAIEIRRTAIWKNRLGGMVVERASCQHQADEGLRKAGRLNPVVCVCSVIDYIEGWDSGMAKFIISLRI